MKVRVLLAGLFVFCVAVAVGPDSRAHAAIGFHIASESYYRLDVPAGSMDVRVEAEVQPASAADLEEVYLWAMPGAQGLEVRSGDTPLEIETSTGDTSSGTLSLVMAKLAKPIRGKQTAKLTMTYTVPPQVNDYVNLEPGLVEALFVSQDGGSFVFIDAPANGDNFFEPGCLEVSDQPGAVKDAGLVRWVCGDSAMIALNTENESVLKQCAALDDRCRQKPVSVGPLELPFPFSGFAQSITDDAKKGVLEADVPLREGNVHLSLKYFGRDRTWADRQFEVARRALPLLEETFNFPYPHDTVKLRQSNYIEFLGAAGLAFTRTGEMLISHSGDLAFDDGITVHELAHQWAGLDTLDHPWLWEGLAEYGARTVQPALGIPLRDWGWEEFGYTDPLATWHNGSEVRIGHYWYGKASAFWFEFEQAIGGPESMKHVLGQLGSVAAPADGRWFMDRGELVSRANLDELFLSWVYVRETSTPLFAERRAAHDQVRELYDASLARGFSGTPSDIRANLDAWQFTNIGSQVSQGHQVLARYDELAAKTTEAGLPVTNAVARSWGEQSMAVTLRLIDTQRGALDAITSATVELAGEAPGSAALQQLAQARDAFAAGDFREAERLAGGAGTTAYNEVASGRMLVIAQEKQANFRPNFLSRIGLMFSDPDGDLARAEAAYADGDSATALSLSRSAYDTWQGAQKRGLMRLAILAAAMCALSVGAWYLLQRLDPRRSTATASGAPTGHVLEERRSNWRDWDSSSGG